MLCRAVILWVALSAPGWAADCKDLSFNDQVFTACKVDVARDELRLFLNDPETGAPLGSFANVETLLEGEGRALGFAMNAGMYHTNRSPVGHYVERGQQVAPVVTREGPGNFGLLPNGVFCIRDGRADVFETRRFVSAKPECIHASQSGPMLVIDGELHPRFLPKSDSRYVRNGVGTSGDGKTAWFVISKRPVTFHEFGTFFKDGLKLPQALYFDGNISRLYAPGLGRFDGGFPMGPIVGVVVKPAE